MNRNFLTVNVKLQKKHTIKYKIVNQEFLRLVVFPEEILLQKTEADHEDLPKRTIKKRKLYLNKQWRILKQKLKKRKVLNAIRTAAESYKDFPLNQVEYVQLLWDALDEIEEEVRHITPIINSSTHNNTMRCLYTILMENSENLIKLIEYEVEPISIFHFEQVCFKLMDNLLTCNRVLLACCYAQNSYQKVNKALENLIVLVEHFEIIVEFVSTAILQSRGRVQNYVPSGRIIRHLNCSMCDTVVSLAGCYCTNWALDSLSSKRAKLFTNPLEDGAVTSSARLFKIQNCQTIGHFFCKGHAFCTTAS